VSPRCSISRGWLITSSSSTPSGRCSPTSCHCASRQSQVAASIHLIKALAAGGTHNSDRGLRREEIPESLERIQHWPTWCGGGDQRNVPTAGASPFRVSVLIKGVDGVWKRSAVSSFCLSARKRSIASSSFSLRMNCPKILTIGLPPRCAMAFSISRRTPNFS